MNSVDDILDELQKLANPDKVLFKQKKFGIIAKNSLGIYHKDLNGLALEIKKNSELAIQLFDTDIYEARILCSKLFKPKDLTEVLMEKWVSTFENWEVCDSFCMGIFAKSSFAVTKANEWSKRNREFEKRAAFAIIAAYCMADKKAENKVFEQFFPLIIEAANDDRIYVKKAISWALRNIGKRNIDLNKQAVEVAKELIQLPYSSAKWIGNDALREFGKEKLRMSDYPRSIYRR